MKRGFEIYIQNDISEEDKLVCKKFADNFILKTVNHPDMRYFGNQSECGYTSGLWRGRYGIEINRYPEYKNISKSIVFRRISKNKRKFALVYTDSLVVRNDSFLDKSHDGYRHLIPDGEIPEDMCKCSRHKGSIKVTWKNKPTFDLYFQIFKEY
jgi:hypothetical protein